MKNSYPVAFACLVTGPGNCQCLYQATGEKSWKWDFVRSSIRFSASWSMEHVHKQTKKTFCNQCQKTLNWVNHVYLPSQNKEHCIVLYCTIISTGRREPGNEVAFYFYFYFYYITSQSLYSIINNIISSSSSSSFLFALLHYSKKVYSYISFGPIFEGNDETIGIIGITGHVHLYLFSV